MKRAREKTLSTTAPERDRVVGAWLLFCAAMVFAMAVIGAITRLTESGLSIMEWAPISGALPPLDEAEWQRLFALYRQIPEYREINAGMSLEEFKTIFWWEYVHRLWGRLIGLVFALPMLWFLVGGRVRGPLRGHLVALLILGGLQGGLGWFMVASGFAQRTDVSQYRLTAHLLAAVGIYGYLLWLAFGQLAAPSEQEPRPALRRALLGVTLLVLVTLTSGGFVAGLNAGLIYNTFPLMDGALVPRDYAVFEPFVWNLFENVATVQFNHRVLAVATLLAVLAVWLAARRQRLDDDARRAFDLLLFVALLQVALGISTLLLVVPVWLAALHQAGAILLFSAALWAQHRLRGAA